MDVKRGGSGRRGGGGARIPRTAELGAWRLPRAQAASGEGEGHRAAQPP